MSPLPSSPSRERTTWPDVPEARRALMRRVRRAHTAPEMIVRRATHKLGFRYRLHVKNLPGRPDLVFPSRRKVIFVHGCFWHQHQTCSKGKVPQIRTERWAAKLARNVERDAANIESLRALHWETLIVWECETRSGQKIMSLLQTFLGHPKGKARALRESESSWPRPEGRQQ